MWHWPLAIAAALCAVPTLLCLVAFGIQFVRARSLHLLPCCAVAGVVVWLLFEQGGLRWLPLVQILVDDSLASFPPRRFSFSETGSVSQYWTGSRSTVRLSGNCLILHNRLLTRIEKGAKLDCTWTWIGTVCIGPQTGSTFCQPFHLIHLGDTPTPHNFASIVGHRPLRYRATSVIVKSNRQGWIDKARRKSILDILPPDNNFETQVSDPATNSAKVACAAILASTHPNINISQVQPTVPACVSPKNATQLPQPASPALVAS